jgi:hypothetical protein
MEDPEPLFDPDQITSVRYRNTRLAVHEPTDKEIEEDENADDRYFAGGVQTYG